MACATAPVTPQSTYMNVQTAYLNAWESYHSVWLALPDTDARKAQWARDYHPKFLQAANLLSQFRVDPSTTNEQLVTNALTVCQGILIQLAITSGGK